MSANNVDNKVDAIETVNILNGARNFFFVVAIVGLLCTLGIMVLSFMGRISGSAGDYTFNCSSSKTSCGGGNCALPEEKTPNQPQDDKNASEQTQETKPEKKAEKKQDIASEEENAQKEKADSKTSSDESEKQAQDLSDEIDKAAEEIDSQAAEAVEQLDKLETGQTTDSIEEKAVEKAAKTSEMELEANLPDELSSEEQMKGEEEAPQPAWQLSFEKAEVILNLSNGVVFFSLLFFAMTCMMSTCVSVSANLGGMSKITSAVLFAGAAVVFFFPWQIPFSELYIAGAMYLPKDIAVFEKIASLSWIDVIIGSLRYAGLWLLVFVLAVFAQINACTWKKQVSKRMGLISG
ncbi:Acyl-CoA cholesterol acyltransferase [Sedimentisphaera cyanobacteriorum]|uniref:Acyl-CoA cholesterol acyltransferase n=1 Tax=Sedimentisphaera cyanobacteriorum TaxID=1940790 RepID=A0A1Q2HMB6_9BACT|nr:hypothetical protein [Sedimentisphaera cyanobacteriorum]AQQ08405.1 Acyl-CoA cholesterol acyltransferase [Sedimentisphaera cyanobacteriorum]